MDHLIVDCETGEESVVPFTADEIAAREAGAVAAAVRDAAEQAAASERATERARLDELKAKGWANLAAAEKTEAQGLMLELS